jgi:hypothetical protein
MIGKGINNGDGSLLGAGNFIILIFRMKIKGSIPLFEKVVLRDLSSIFFFRVTTALISPGEFGARTPGDVIDSAEIPT